MLVFMFPGQNSRYPGMLHKLIELHPPNAEVVQQASDILGRDLLALYHADNPDIFSSSRDMQVGVFLATHLFYCIVEASGLKADLSLGLSLGEYNHLIQIGALDFEQTLRTVERRGVVYNDAPQGTAAAIFPLKTQDVEAVVEQSLSFGALEVACYNSPLQHVISGEPAAVEEALRILEDEYYIYGTYIDTVPVHCSLLQPTSEAFAPWLDEMPFALPHTPYIPNRTGEILSAPTPEEFRPLLAEQLRYPVLWQKSINAVLERSPNAVFLEIGPKRVLFDLLDPRWCRNPKYHLDSAEDTAQHIDELLEQLLQAQAHPAGTP